MVLYHLCIFYFLHIFIKYIIVKLSLFKYDFQTQIFFIYKIFISTRLNNNIYILKILFACDRKKIEFRYILLHEDKFIIKYMENTNMIWIVGRGIYALNYIRFLHFNVNLITTDKYDFAGISKYVKQVYYVNFDKNYCSTIQQLVKNDIVIAIGEETLYLDDHIKKTGSQINLLGNSYDLPDYQPRLKYHNKANFMDLIRTLNLPCLETWNSGHTVEIYKSGKYLLKLINSRGGIGQQIIQIQNTYTVPENYILQPYVKTKKDYSTFVIATKGHIQQYVGYECIDMIDGFSTERIKVDIKDLFYQTEKIVQGLNYAIDFNPRITNGISLLKNNVSISTLPYLSKKMSINRIIKSIKYSDVISFFDILPFFYMIVIFIRLIILSFLNLTRPSVYVRKYIEKSVVKYD